MRDGPIYSPDSDSYINLSVVRMGLYPLMVSLFQYIFKERGFQALIGFQVIFAISTSYFLAIFLKKSFNLPSMFQWILISVFLFPVVILKSSNHIMSEGLSYPLLLMTSLFLLKGVFYKKTNDLCLFFL
jgi:hypothetical protein